MPLLHKRTQVLSETNKLPSKSTRVPFTNEYESFRWLLRRCYSCNDRDTLQGYIHEQDLYATTRCQTVAGSIIPLQMNKCSTGALRKRQLVRASPHDYSLCNPMTGRETTGWESNTPTSESEVSSHNSLTHKYRSLTIQCTWQPVWCMQLYAYTYHGSIPFSKAAITTPI